MSNLIEIVKTEIVWSTRKSQDQMQGLRVKWFSIELGAPLFVNTCKDRVLQGSDKFNSDNSNLQRLTLQCLSNFGKGYFYERRPTLQTALYIAETLNLPS